MSLLERFQRDGLAVIENFFTEEEIEEMKKEIARYVAELNVDEHPKTVFSTYDNDKHAADEYFLESSDKVRYFFEEDAFDQEGNLTVSKERAINKIGHALHELSPIFKRLTFSSKVQDVLKQLHFEAPVVVQSMYIFKQPRIGGAVTSHIDATFLFADPIDRLVGLWVACEDANQSNGCLAFIPGSHKKTAVEQRFVRTHDKSGGPLLRFDGQKPVYNDSEFVAAPVKKGSLVLIHGLVVHKSEKNTSEESRHAFTLHVLDAKNAKWSKDNWLQETETYKFPPLYTNA